MKPAIIVSGLSKQYQIGARQSEGYGTLRESLMWAACTPWRMLRASLAGRDAAHSASEKRPRDLWALNDVSLKIMPGELVGIIGRNGAGKSTLLKVLSRITEPTCGRVELRGQVSSLLEVGTGFHPELTGRENVYLNGAILGMPRTEIARQFDAIVAFAELDALIDTPVKRYSSGMYVRLAFAVAAHLNPHILLIDEVLAVGDLAFQRKCMEHVRRLKERDAAVVLVSHNMFAIKAICNRVLYMSGGRLTFDGSPNQAIELYEKESQLDLLPWAKGRLGGDTAGPSIEITRVDLLDEAGRPRTVFEFGERMRVRIHFEAHERVADPNFVVTVMRSDSVACCNHSTAMDGAHISSVSGPGIVELYCPPIKLVSELYSLHVIVWDRAFQKLHCAQVGASFHVRHEVLSTHFGVFHEPAEWKWQPVASEITNGQP
jgi:lipopolysaccharide transport system ATP-binding protein